MINHKLNLLFCYRWMFCKLSFATIQSCKIGVDQSSWFLAINILSNCINSIKKKQHVHHLSGNLGLIQTIWLRSRLLVLEWLFCSEDPWSDLFELQQDTKCEASEMDERPPVSPRETGEEDGVRNPSGCCFRSIIWRDSFTSSSISVAPFAVRMKLVEEFSFSFCNSRYFVRSVCAHCNKTN